MNLFRIAFRSIQQRGVSSALTILSMALGVTLVVLVLTIHGVVEYSFQSNAALGYNVIVGAKGGREQLVLNTVYYLSAPVENVRYGYYLEFLPKAQRDAEIANSYAYHGWQAQQEMAEALAATGLDGGLPAAVHQALAQAEADRAKKALELGRDGIYASYCELVVPVCLGDYFGGYRVVGTTPDFFDKFEYREKTKYEFIQGRNFKHEDAENGYFEAVVGSSVASKQYFVVKVPGGFMLETEVSDGDEVIEQRRIKLGDRINPRHGAPDGHTHERPFTVVGILKASGTPNDRAVFVNMEGFYLMEDHAKPLEEQTVTGQTKEAEDLTDEDKQALAEAREKEAAQKETPAHDAAASLAGIPPLPMEQREITSLLVRAGTFVSPGLQNAVNEGRDAQAVFPVSVIFGMFQFIVNPIRNAFIAITLLICGVSGLSILISIYNSMSERRHEIAVMRALGAGRETVFSIILMESALLALAGGFCGWVVGHVICVAMSPMVEEQTGVSIGLWNTEPSFPPLLWLGLNKLGISEDWLASQTVPVELLLVPGLLMLAIIVGLWPAVSAYRTDVAQSLGK